MATCAGIDVAKDRLDVALARWHSHLTEAPKNRRPLEARPSAWETPSKEGIGTSDGPERPVVAALGAADLPIIIVNSIQTSGFPKSFGRLVQTAQIDAKMLALFGERAVPEPRSLPSEAQQELEALAKR